MFPRGDKDSCYRLFFSTSGPQEARVVIYSKQTYHPAFPRISGCLPRNSLYRHVCSLPTVLMQSVPHGGGESRRTQVLLCHSPSHSTEHHTPCISITWLVLSMQTKTETLMSLLNLKQMILPNFFLTQNKTREKLKNSL